MAAGDPEHGHAVGDGAARLPRRASGTPIHGRPMPATVSQIAGAQPSRSAAWIASWVHVSANARSAVSSEERVDGHRSPLAITPRRISLVPPRTVHDGATSTARASSRWNVDDDAERRLDVDQRLDARHHLLLELGAEVFAERGLDRRLTVPSSIMRATVSDTCRMRPPARDGVAEEAHRVDTERRRRTRAGSARPPGYGEIHRSGPARSKLSSDVFCAQPWPSPPSSRSSGTNTPSNTTSLKSSVPSRNGIGLTVTPGECRSTISWLKPGVTVVGVARAAQHDGVVGEVRVARPDLRARQLVATVDLRRSARHRREVAPRVGLAHADRERELAPADRAEGSGASAPRSRTG